MIILLRFDIIYLNCLALTWFQIAELNKLIRDMKLTPYGSAESEPVAEACKKLTEEFFKEDTLRLLIICLPRLNLEVGSESCIFFN